MDSTDPTNGAKDCEGATIFKATSKQQDTTIVAIAVLGALLGVTSALSLCCLGSRLCRRKKTGRPLSSFRRKFNLKTRKYISELPSRHHKEDIPYAKKWEFPKTRLKLGRTLGQGAFGKVVKGKAIGLHDFEPKTVVAVKMLKDGANENQQKALIDELKILMNLGQHVNIQNLLGAVTKVPRQLMIIVEYCRYGNLKYYLEKNRDDFAAELRTERKEKQFCVLSTSKHYSLDETGCHSFDSASSTSSGECETSTKGEMSLKSTDTEPPVPGAYPSEDSCDSDGSYIVMSRKKRCITTNDLICYAFQCARGMEYLASTKHIHGDLAARNVLLSSGKIIKICDFGLARNLYDYPNYVKKGKNPLPLRWMALESLSRRVFTEKTDVWSFGVFLWEIFSLGGSPYPGIPMDENFYGKLKGGYRMRKPEYAPRDIYQIMLDCWKENPEDRPYFRTLVQILGDQLSADVKQHYVELNMPYVKRNQLALDHSETAAAVLEENQQRVNIPQPEHSSHPQEKHKTMHADHIYVNERSTLEQSCTHADDLKADDDCLKYNVPRTPTQVVTVVRSEHDLRDFTSS